MGKNTPDRQAFILENLVVEDPDINKKEILSEAADEIA
jgi:topoisomerase-4 subunit B